MGLLHPSTQLGQGKRGRCRRKNHTAKKEGAALCLAWTLWKNQMFTEGFEVVLRHPLGPLGKASAR